jgi:putative component of membrane protein insertase Oxa1/YidC/SpoIIIJ protein YidD
MRDLLLWLIRFYQTKVSPHKGFHCAYRCLTGKRSCSSYGYVAIQRHGSILGLRLLRSRFQRCSAASGKLADRSQRMRSGLAHQSGHCDLPIGDCGHGVSSDLLGCASCDDCGCDLQKKRPSPRNGKDVEIRVR